MLSVDDPHESVIELRARPYTFANRGTVGWTTSRVIESVIGVGID
jgi:hypothetical protein